MALAERHRRPTDGLPERSGDSPRKNYGEITETPRRYDIGDYLDLSEGEVMIVEIREDLYFGNTDNLIRDLEDRKAGRPYIFKLANKLDEDIARAKGILEIERLSRGRIQKETLPEGTVVYVMKQLDDGETWGGPGESWRGSDHGDPSFG
jgi:hypothetical protein